MSELPLLQLHLLGMTLSPTRAYRHLWISTEIKESKVLDLVNQVLADNSRQVESRLAYMPKLISVTRLYLESMEKQCSSAPGNQKSLKTALLVIEHMRANTNSSDVLLRLQLITMNLQQFER